LFDGQGAQGPFGGGAFTGTVNLVFFQQSLPTGWTAANVALNDKILRVVNNGGSGTNAGGYVQTTTSKNFTNIFKVSYATNAHTLTVNQIPSHNHPGSSAGNSTGTHDHSGTVTGVNAPHGHPIGSHRHNLVGVEHSGAPSSNDDIANNIIADRFRDTKPDTNPREYNLKKSPNQSAYTGGVSSSVDLSAAVANAPHSHPFSISSQGGHDHPISIASQGGSSSHSHEIDLDINYVNVIIGSRTFP
jgi:hypothetical protein